MKIDEYHILKEFRKFYYKAVNSKSVLFKFKLAFEKKKSNSCITYEE